MSEYRSFVVLADTIEKLSAENKRLRELLRQADAYLLHHDGPEVVELSRKISEVLEE